MKTASRSFDPNRQTPDMSIDVSLGEFHGTHDKASEIVDTMRTTKLSTWTREELSRGLAKLNAAQALTNAETGSDCMYARSYGAEILELRAELAKRPKN